MRGQCVDCVRVLLCSVRIVGSSCPPGWLEVVQPAQSRNQGQDTLMPRHERVHVLSYYVQRSMLVGCTTWRYMQALAD